MHCWNYLCGEPAVSEKKDWNLIAGVEKAIKETYGEEAVRNPSSDWTDEQEEEHLKQLKIIATREQQRRTKSEKVEVSEGVFVSKKLFKGRVSNRTCPVCETYSFDSRDDVYMKKFECCWSCYIQHVESREERWMRGWRPKIEHKEKSQNG